MPKMIFSHAVRDRDHWATFHADRVRIFAPFATDLAEHFNIDGGNTVSISVNVHDLDGLQALLKTPENVALRDNHGVVEPIAIYAENS